MYRTHALSLVWMVLAALPGAADTCVPRAEICAQERTSELPDGFQITETCVRMDVSETCTGPDPENTCSSLQQSAACTRMASDCIAMNSGECDRERKRFECLNADSDMAPARLVERRFENLREDVSDGCQELANESKCLLSNTTNIDPGGTRDINGLAVSRPWWQKRRDYVCVSGQSENTCSAFEGDPVCRIMASSCLSSTPDGVCIQEEFRYKCGVEGNLDTSCRRVDVCVAGNCDGFEEPANEDFPRAAAWLNVLDEMTREADTDDQTDPADVVFFGGENRDCRQTALGFRNCCELKGWIAGGECREDEHDLFAARQAGAAHYVGSYCSISFLWICTAHKRTYCRFGSKFARVFQEQARDQLGWSWGEASSPDCRGLTVADLDQVDLEAFDLSEIYGDMLDEADRPDASQIMEMLRRNMNLAPRQARALYE